MCIRILLRALSISLIISFVFSNESRITSHFFKKYTPGQELDHWFETLANHTVRSDVECAMICASKDNCDAYLISDNENNANSEMYACELQKETDIGTTNKEIRSDARLFIKKRAPKLESTEPSQATSTIETSTAALTTKTPDATISCTVSAAVYAQNHILIFSTDGTICVVSPDASFQNFSPIKSTGNNNIATIFTELKPQTMVTVAFSVAGDKIIIVSGEDWYYYQITIDGKGVVKANQLGAPNGKKDVPFPVKGGLDGRLGEAIGPSILLIDNQNQAFCYPKNGMICDDQCDKGAKSKSVPPTPQNGNKCTALGADIISEKYSDVVALVAKDENNIAVVTDHKIEKYPRT